MRPVKVRILDQEYLVRSDGDEEQVHRIAEYVDEKLREVKENAEGLSGQKAAILAALNIASEYFHLLKERDDLMANVRKRTKALIYHIDSKMR